MKKIMIALLASVLCLSSGVCKPMSKSIEGKDGLFAVLETEKGTITMELFYKETPLTCVNFVGLAEGTLDAAKGKKFYDGLTFHRVISKANGDGQDFMIQGGDPQGTGAGGPGYRFADEIVDSLKFDKGGYLAMANAGAGTNGSQFFITIVPTTWLNGKHTIFGKVVDEESQKVVNSVTQGDHIKSLSIVRNGVDAAKFSATQADFDREAKVANAKVEERKKAEREAAEKAMQSVIADCTKSKEGIYFKTLKEGKGNKIGKGKNAFVEYKGYLVDGTVFDGSAKMVSGGHEGLSFRVGAGQMIAGFDIMVQDMKVGETRKMVIPPDFAYGARGIPGVIPGGAYICFDVMLVSAK